MLSIWLQSRELHRFDNRNPLSPGKKRAPLSPVINRKPLEEFARNHPQQPSLDNQRPGLICVGTMAIIAIPLAFGSSSPRAVHSTYLLAPDCWRLALESRAL